MTGSARVLAFIAMLAPAAQAQVGTVTGQLLNDRGVPVAGVRVAAMPVPREGDTTGPTLIGLTLTDSNGRYTIEMLEPGTYYVTAGRVNSPSYYPGVGRLSAAKSILVTAGARISGIDFLAPANPEIVSLRVVLSAYRDNVEIRTQSHILDVEVGAVAANFRSGNSIPLSNGGQTFQWPVGIQIDSEVRSAEQGRYRALTTITKRDVDGSSGLQIPERVPSIPIFYNFIFAGALILGNGETAQISGTDTIRNETWRADITLSLKK